jgi:hypothetical protein
VLTQHVHLSAGEWALVGGIYLVPDMPAEELDRILATDPYLISGVAEHSVTEFTPLPVATGLEDLNS